MKKELTEEQIRDKELLNFWKKDIAIARLRNIKNGLLIGISSLGLVAGSLLGITGATLTAVGLQKRDTTIATYMASEDFQVKKAEQQERKNNLTDVLSQMQEYQNQDYFFEKEYITQKIKEINNESDYDFAKRVLLEDENNELHGILKDSNIMSEIGSGLLFCSVTTFLLKTFAWFDNCSLGKDCINTIKEAAEKIEYYNEYIAGDKENIRELKNNRKESEENNEETNENEDQI